jgi:cytochrome P450
MALLPKFDPLAPEVVDDPYPTYARLREAGPLCRGPVGTWIVTRHADVSSALKHPRLGSAFPDSYHRLSAGDGPAGRFLARIVLYRDPPEHTRLRRLLGAAFAHRVRGLRPRVEALVDDLLAPALEAGRADLIGELAFPLPLMVVCGLMGIPAVDEAAIRRRAIDLDKGFAPVVPAEARTAVDEAVVWLRDYVAAMLAERRGRPGDDLLSDLLAAAPGEDGADEEQLVDNAVFAFFAGFETTTNLIGNGFAALLAHPDQLVRLRRDPSLTPTAVEEFLRFDAPVQGVARFVREPVRIGGRTIRAGRVVTMLLGSANRDERVFPDGDRLDVGRAPNPYVSFGGGPHRCLGAMLARLEAEVVFGGVLRSCRTIEPAGPPVRSRASAFRGYAALPVAVRA